MNKLNSAKWMEATMVRRANGEAPKVALANAFCDVTGLDFAAYQAEKRTALRIASKIAIANHGAKAAAQRAAGGWL